MKTSRQISSRRNLQGEAMCHASESWDISGACYTSSYLTPTCVHSWWCPRREADKSKGSQRYEWKRANCSHHLGVLKLALPLLEPSCLSFAYRPLLLHQCQHKHLCGCRTPPTSQSMSYNQILLSLGHCARTWWDKNRLGNVHLKASALLWKIWCYIWSWLTRREKTCCSSCV